MRGKYEYLPRPNILQRIRNWNKSNGSNGSIGMKSQEYWHEKCTEELEAVMADIEEKGIKEIDIAISNAFGRIYEEFDGKVEDITDQYADGIQPGDLQDIRNHYHSGISTKLRDALVQTLQENYRLKATQC